MATNNDTNAVGIVAILIIVLIAAGLGYYFLMVGPRGPVTAPSTTTNITTPATPSSSTTNITTPSTTTKETKTTSKSY